MTSKIPAEHSEQFCLSEHQTLCYQLSPLVQELFYKFLSLIIFAFSAPGPKKQGESSETQDNVS